MIRNYMALVVATVGCLAVAAGLGVGYLVTDAAHAADDCARAERAWADQMRTWSSLNREHGRHGPTYDVWASEQGLPTSYEATVPKACRESDMGPVSYVRTTATPEPVAAETKTVEVPGATRTRVVRVETPGPTRTVKVPGPEVTVTATETVPVPGPTVAVPGPTVTVYETVTAEPETEQVPQEQTEQEEG